MKAEEYNESQAGRLWSLNDLPGDLARVAGLHGVNSIQFVNEVREIQAVRGMTVDGKLGPRTWAVLRSERDAGPGDVLMMVGGVIFRRPTRAEARPGNMIETDDGHDRVASLWNHYGGAIAELAREHDIPIGVALAVFVTEAGRLAYDPGTGLIIIRFEQHLFRRRNGLTGARMRHDGKQLTEWTGLQIAAGKNLNQAFECTSFGLAQIMGFNYRSVGYGSAVEMARAFQDDVVNQVRGFFDFCKNGGLDTLIRRRDWQGFTRRYNGPGQVAHYSSVLESHLAIVGRMGFDV